MVQIYSQSAKKTLSWNLKEEKQGWIVAGTSTASVRDPFLRRLYKYLQVQILWWETIICYSFIVEIQNVFSMYCIYFLFSPDGRTIKTGTARRDSANSEPSARVPFYMSFYLRPSTSGTFLFLFFIQFYNFNYFLHF